MKIFMHHIIVETNKRRKDEKGVSLVNWTTFTPSERPQNEGWVCHSDSVCLHNNFF